MSIGHKKMSIHRNGMAAAALLGLAAVLTGCGHGSGGGTGTTGGTTAVTPAAGGGAGTLEIAVIPKGTSHEYWKSIHAGGDQGFSRT